jgi:hypothetical protein
LFGKFFKSRFFNGYITLLLLHLRMKAPSLLALWLLLVLTLTRTAVAADEETWWSKVAALANDNMEGRLTVREGYRRAAQYVAAEFERAGLKPVGTKAYFQPMKYRVRQINEEKSQLELIRDGRSEQLVLGDEATFGLPADMVRHVKAPAVFVGYGLVLPELGINDLAGLDLKGKIAVVLGGAPKGVSPALQAHSSSAREQWKALRNAGAIGIVSLRTSKSMDIPWDRAKLARFQPTMSLADPALNDTAGLKLSLRVNPAHADKLFVGTGHTFSELEKLANDKQPLPRFPLTITIDARVTTKRSTVESMNVAALLEGADPQLKKEFVVLSAHLDHLGIGEPINGDKIYNGALDNAAGVASLLEIARMLKESGTRLKRSVLFLLVTGEEKGLQGSKYFAHYPTVPREAIVANLNEDMFLPLFPLKYVRVLGLEESTLGDQIRAICSEKGVFVHGDHEPERNAFIRSDQYSFIRQGIPALKCDFGYQLNSREHQVVKEWLKNRYHAPSDDLNQPVDKAAAAQYNRVLFALLERVANDPERPRWREASFFRRFAREAKPAPPAKRSR